MPKKFAFHKKQEEGKLKKTLGLWEITLSGIGIILGAGIYVLLGKAAGLAGYGIWLSFMIGAFLAAFTGLSYAELASRFPKAGGEYVYVKHAFNKTLAFVIGWLIILEGIISAAAVALGFGGYLASITGLGIIFGAILIIFASTILILYDLKESVLIGIVCTIIELLGLAIILFFGLPRMNIANLMEIPSFISVWQAAALVFFAYIGFGSMVRLSEETKSATKNIPQGILIAIAVSAIVYILVAIAAVSLMPPQALAASDAPLADAIGSVLGNNIFLILAVIALFATANTVLFVMLTTSRIVYGMAELRSLPISLSFINPVTHTPIIATILVAVFSLLFVFVGNIETVANLTNFMVFCSFILVNGAAIVLRYTENEHPPFKMPLNIGKFPLPALLGLLFSIALLLSMADLIPYGIILIIAGIIIEHIVNKRGR
ncbi:MAG: amino acid permease [archaeon]